MDQLSMLSMLMPCSGVPEMYLHGVGRRELLGGSRPRSKMYQSNKSEDQAEAEVEAEVVRW